MPELVLRGHVMLLAANLRRVSRGTRAGSMASVLGLRALALGVNLGTGLVTAAVLGPAGRGEQAALLVGPQFLAAIATLGLHASLIYNMKADPAQERRYFGSALLLALMAGIAFTAVGWLLLPRWLHQYDAGTIHTARLVLLVTPLGVVTPLLTGALEAHGQFSTANRTLYLQSLATLIALGVLWYTGNLTPVTAAIAYIFPAFPAAAYFSRHIFRMMPPLPTLKRPIPQRLLHYGLRFYGVDLLGSIAGYLDQIVIVALLQDTMVGIYVVALSLSRILTVLQGAITSVLFPTIAARAEASVIEAVALTVRVSTVVNALAAVALALIGPYALHLLYGDRFIGAVGPFRILLLETVVSSAARILYQIFSGTGRPGVVTAIEATGVSASMIAMLLLVPTFGIDGAACSVLLASSLRLICVVVSLPYIMRVRLPRLFLNTADLASILGR
jgi:O-antigen/teichoic acid export membrane protein